MRRVTSGDTVTVMYACVQSVKGFPESQKFTQFAFVDVIEFL